MTTAGEGELIAHVRRLAADGACLYVRIDANDVRGIGLQHRDRLELEVGSKVRVNGIVKTSGGSPWLAPAHAGSNAEITSVLRRAGFGHGDDLSAVLCDRRTSAVHAFAPPASTQRLRRRQRP